MKWNRMTSTWERGENVNDYNKVSYGVAVLIIVLQILDILEYLVLSVHWMGWVFFRFDASEKTWLFRRAYDGKRPEVKSTVLLALVDQIELQKIAGNGPIRWNYDIGNEGEDGSPIFPSPLLSFRSSKEKKRFEMLLVVEQLLKWLSPLERTEHLGRARGSNRAPDNRKLIAIYI